MNLLFFIFLVIPFILFPGTTGKIVGEVLDKTNDEPLIGVNIVIEGTMLGATTDLEGRYLILNVPPGNYVVEAQYIGYTPVKVQNVKVNVDLTTTLNYVMQENVLELDEEIVVVAERELVVKDLTASTATVNAEDIAVLPITEISEALELQAGYVDGHSRGGRKGEVAYWIDGVPITDVYDGGQVVEVNKDMVEQLQFISGAFNAEYGQAMSGIVNITTKDPPKEFGGNITLYAGDFYSTNGDIFWNLNNFDPTNIYNAEGGIYGSILPGKLSYFLTGRYIYFGGWQYGKRVFNPENIAYEDSAGEYILHALESGKGGGDFIPMNWNRKVYLQGKLIYNFSPVMKVFYSFIRDDVNFEEYDRNYKLNPDGNLNRFRTGNTHLLKLSHTISTSTFYDVSLSYFDKTYKQYVYEDKFDNRYVHPIINENQLQFSFKSGGTNNQYFVRNTKTALLKIDLSSQITRNHLMKLGIETRRHEINLDDITLRPTDFSNFPFMDPFIPDLSTPYHSKYEHKPFEFSVYLQDKMEFEDIIVNVGVRMDHFRPDGVVLADPSDPNIYSPIKPENRYDDVNENGIEDPGEKYTFKELEKFWYKEATNKTKLSPRLGISFPITETGVVHFSYGHFFQIPNFEILYRNPQFRLGTGTGNEGEIGNADLKPEQTISAEIGLQQQLGTEIVLDATAYFRDIRDLAGTRADEIEIFGGSARYSKLVNSDFGFVRGFILSLKNKFRYGINYTFDYTFQLAKGTSSDPSATQKAIAGGNLPEVQLTPLDWDQTHTLNSTVSYRAETWGLSFIGNLGSGLPYTPRKTEDVSELRQNSEKKPMNWNVDMRFHKDFELLSYKFTIFLRILNLFDRLNETNVYDDTGRAGFTTDLDRVSGLNPFLPVNSLKDWYTNITHYSEPRRIEFGVQCSF
jgi:outer membrane receptor protein involved in Fe transport